VGLCRHDGPQVLAERIPAFRRERGTVAGRRALPTQERAPQLVEIGANTVDTSMAVTSTSAKPTVSNCARSGSGWHGGERVRASWEAATGSSAVAASQKSRIS
jgi:hypothetical protein